MEIPNSVEYRGKVYKVKKRVGLLTLKLSNKEIENISEIKGLNLLSDLEVLLLDHNNLVKIHGLNSLKSLKALDLSSNRITKIEGLEQLSNLEELNFDFNQIEVLEALDHLTKLKKLSFFKNNISLIQSFENKDGVTSFFLGYSNPVYKEIKSIFGVTNVQSINQFVHMSEEEKIIMRKKNQEEEYKNRVEIKTKRIEQKKQEKIFLALTLLIGIVLGIIGAIMLFNSFSGLFAIFSGGLFPPSTITAIVLIIIALILVGVGSKGQCCDISGCDCSDCVCDC